MDLNVRLILPLPLRQQFDYLLSDFTGSPDLLPGCRAQVPFGSKTLTGLITAVVDQPEVNRSKIKKIHKVIDQSALMNAQAWALLHWVSEYYHAPLGDVLATALPRYLLKGQPAVVHSTAYYKLSDSGEEALAQKRVKSNQQKHIMQLIKESPCGLTEGEIQLCGFSARPLQNLLKKQWLIAAHDSAYPVKNPVTQERNTAPLTDEQQKLVDAVCSSSGFQPFLVDGVTGSGKTEVYLQAIEHALKQGKQALVLIPEIGLSPQTWQRFQKRLNTHVVVLHSQLPDTERGQAWLQARLGQARVVIGTRSAVFTPLPELGIIVVDEEHDPSFKQQSGLRYNARDIALVRAKQDQLPIILGSATPSLESLRNVERGLYQYWRLSYRATGAPMPSYQVIDLRRKRLNGGLSEQALAAIAEHLNSGKQALVFINRRGYAPTLFCRQCGWTAQCKRCDARMTLHQSINRLCCHHCGAFRPVDRSCQGCGGSDLVDLGTGTEKLETTLSERLPDYPLIRVDRDRVRNLKEMEQQLETAYQGQPAILVGTQMLAKGHHFPQLTLVVAVNPDQGLLSADFRGTERMAQTLTQVAGRAGREAEPGTVLIQTYQPQHPVLKQLVQKGYGELARALLEERRACQLPPHGYLALFRAEAAKQQPPVDFLSAVSDCLQTAKPEEVEVMGPFPAPMERRAGRCRQQLFVNSPSRRQLSLCLNNAMPAIEKMKLAKSVRWSLDKDPYDLF